MFLTIGHGGCCMADFAKLIAPMSYALYCYCQVFPPTAVSFPRQPLSVFPTSACKLSPPTASVIAIGQK